MPLPVRIAVLTCFVAYLVVLAGCASGDSAELTASGATDSPATETAPADASPEAGDAATPGPTQSITAPQPTAPPAAAPTPTPSATSASPTPTYESDSTVEPPRVLCGASIEIVFDEGAPRDRMLLVNTSTSAAPIAVVTFDLSASAGQIIFDTVEGGEGVEVFQDFRVETGTAQLAEEPVATDGSNQLTLSFSQFASGDSFEFSIDVDDQLTDSDLGQIQVTGAEIAGAEVVVEFAEGEELIAAFGADSSASAASDC